MTTRHDVWSRHAAKFQVVANSARGARSGLQYFVHTTIAVVLATAMYQTARAQEAPAAQSEKLLEVVVTGSRIQRSADLQSSSPLVTVSSDVLTNISTVGVENALNQLPQFVAAQTQFVISSNGTNSAICSWNIEVSTHDYSHKTCFMTSPAQRAGGERVAQDSRASQSIVGALQYWAPGQGPSDDGWIIS